MLSVGSSGSVGNYIIIRPGQDIGHNGIVLISNTNHGINIYGNDYVEINGRYPISGEEGNRHIKIDGVSGNGIYSNNGADALKIMWVEMTNWNSADSSDVEGIYSGNGTGAGCEIAYNLMYSPGFDIGCDAIKIYAQGSNYGDNSIHHNIIYNIPDDGIFVGNGFDIYNNFLDSEQPTLRDYGHPDGLFNHNGVSYVRIYNNYIANFANDLLFFEGRESSNHHIKIYNNIWTFTEYHDHGWEAISIVQRDYGSPGIIKDILIANNLFVDIYNKAIEIKNLDVSNGEINNIIVKNNMFINSGNIILLEHDTGATGTFNGNIFDYNVLYAGEHGGLGINWEGETETISSLQSGNGWSNYDAIPNFVSYESYPDDEISPTTNDYHLINEDMVAKDIGTNLSTYFTTDKDGITRPQGALWDIGAYEYNQTPPTFTTNTGTSPTPTNSDTINITVADDNGLDTTSLEYGFSVDNTCNDSDTYGNSFTNSTDFTISTAHTDYLCVKATDTSDNTGYHLVGQLNIETTEPTRSNSSPTGTLNSGTTNTTISITTDENSTCKYSTTADTAYASIPNTFTTTGETTHSQAITGLSNGNDYSYFVRCIDTATNQNTTDYPISFSVNFASGGGIAFSQNLPTPPASTTDNPNGEFKIVINNNDETTNNSLVSLKLYAGSDTTNMALSNREDFEYASIIPYESISNFQFSISNQSPTSNNQTLTIYAKFYTQYGVASEVVSDSIVYVGEANSNPAPDLNPDQDSNPTSILNGSLIRAINQIKVYITKLNYRRHVISSEIFNFYNHLNWGAIQEVSTATINSYQESYLIRADSDYKVYEIKDGKKYWLDITAEEFVDLGYKWEEVYVVNERELGWYQ